MNAGNVRLATAEDYTLLCHLFRQIDDYHRQLFPHIFNSYEGDPRAYDYYIEVIDNEDSDWFVTELANQLVAFMKVQKGQHPPYHLFLPYEFVQIDSLFVQADCRGQGMAQQLINVAKEWGKARGLTEIRLSVYAGNDLALHFYQKQGFTPLKHTLSLPIESV